MTKKSSGRREREPRKLKVGEDLEILVAWIHECLQDRATIRHNVKLWSRESKSFRQVDIAIRVADGPLDFLTIVEVRDKSRPAEPNHIGALEHTRIAVGAQRAIYVSKCGFSKAALEQAKFLGILAFSFSEARTGDWSGWFQSAVFVKRHLKSRKNVTLSLLPDGDDNAISLDEDIVEWLKANIENPILENAEGMRVVGMSQLISAARSACEDEILAQVPLDGRHTSVRVEHIFSASAPQLWLRTSVGKRVRIRGVALEDEFWFDVQNCPTSLSHYTNDATDAQMGENLRMEAALPNDLSFRIDLFHSNGDLNNNIHIRPSIVKQ